jgi:hypothetical protein
MRSAVAPVALHTLRAEQCFRDVALRKSRAKPIQRLKDDLEPGGAQPVRARIVERRFRPNQRIEPGDGIKPDPFPACGEADVRHPMPRRRQASPAPNHELNPAPVPEQEHVVLPRMLREHAYLNILRKLSQSGLMGRGQVQGDDRNHGMA